MKLLLQLYLAAGDLLVIDDEPVGHGWGKFDGLQPETHVTLLQNLIVKSVFQRNNCTETEKQIKLCFCAFPLELVPVIYHFSETQHEVQHSLGCLMA